MTQRPPGTTTTRDVRMQVAGYRIQDILGDGASAIVFAAVDATGRDVALKVLKPELALSEKERRRFVEEAARMRRVKHPSLVELIDAGELPDGGAYIAMARVPGVTLAERLAQGPIRFDVILSLFEQLADALGVLHAQGFVHRDVKPENIFIEAGDRRAILLDLGIARDLSSNPSTTTRAGMIRGTPAYMAPERFFGKPATPQTDIYELGVVLYYTLVGALPWSSFDNPTERLKPLQPTERGVVLPPRLTTALMRALSAEADKRPASAAEFGAAVSDALSPESLQWIAGERTARGLPPVASPIATPSRTVSMTSPPAPTFASSQVVPHSRPQAAHAPPAPPPSFGSSPSHPMPASQPSYGHVVVPASSMTTTKRSAATPIIAILGLALFALVAVGGTFVYLVYRQRSAIQDVAVGREGVDGTSGNDNDALTRWEKLPTQEELTRFKPAETREPPPAKVPAEELPIVSCGIYTGYICKQLRGTHPQCQRALGLARRGQVAVNTSSPDPETAKQVNDACAYMLARYRGESPSVPSFATPEAPRRKGKQPRP